jgi:hypothetical protein
MLMGFQEEFPACDFVPSEAQADMDGALARLGRIGEEGINANQQLFTSGACSLK